MSSIHYLSNNVHSDRAINEKNEFPGHHLIGGGYQMWTYNYLCHFGILGQKWGVRRYQNEDGTLTPEGRERYLGSDSIRENGAITRATYDVYNKTADRANSGLRKINKDFDKKYGADYDLEADDKANLEYTRQVRDLWQKTYRDVLAEDLGTDSSSLEGQKWLDDMFGYKSNLDTEVKRLEKKLKGKEKQEKQATAVSKRVTSTSVSNKASSSGEKYANTKMTQAKAIKTAYADLEKKYPNFDDFSIDKQDKLFFDYINSSGLYRWM